MGDLHSFIDTLKETVSVSAVISRFVKLKRHGHEFQGICPFHNEKTPSFTVNDHKGFYYCFGCGVSGDGLRFLMDHQKIPFPEAVKQIADMAGLTVPELESKQRPKDNHYERLYQLLEEATCFFQDILRKTSHAQAYLEKRKIPQDVLKRYRLGFSTNAVIDHLKNKGFTILEMERAGLTVGDNKAVSRFRDRLIFPICDAQGRVIAFGGRAMGEDQQPKYLNGPETALFHKSIHLFGINHIKGVRSDNPLIVVEGYMDVIRCQEAGLNAVAPLGTALTADHIQRLWRMDKEPVLCFDGDLAGEKAMVRAAYRALPILKPGYSLKFCALPFGHDPDSFVKEKSKEAFCELIFQSYPLVDIVLNDYDAQINKKTPEQKARIKTDFFKEIDGITDVHIKGFYKDSFYKRYAKPLAANPNKGFGKNNGNVAAHTTLSGVKWSRELCEKILLVTLVNHPTLISVMAEHLTSVDWSLSGAKPFIMDALHESGVSDMTFLSNELLQKYEVFIKMLGIEDIALLAPFSQKEAEMVDAEQGFINVFHSVFTKKQIEKTLAEVKKKLANQFDQDSWQMFQQLKKELQAL